MYTALLGGVLMLAVTRSASPVMPPSERSVLDEQRSHFTFRVDKRYGQAVEGQFKRADGFLLRNARGERRVVIELDAHGIDVANSRLLTRIARSDAFFGAERYPDIVFESDWHSPDLLMTGGSMQGRVTLRGIKRTETFRISPATCARPGLDCDVEAKGSVNRKAYGITSMDRILAPDVELTLKVRFKSAGS